MAAPGKEDLAAEHAGRNSKVEGRSLILPPSTSDDIRIMSAGLRESGRVDSLSLESELRPTQRTSLLLAEEQMQTPKSEQPPSWQSLVTSRSSDTVQGRHQPPLAGTDVHTATCPSQDYFGSNLPDGSEAADVEASAPMSPSTDYSPSLDGASFEKESSTPASPGSHAFTWTEFSAKHVASPPCNKYGNVRPTSVPNFQAKPASRRREGPDYPKYPDQSFKALESQRYPPPYRPSSPPPLMTRKSHLSQNSSFSSIDNRSASELPHLPSGAKTAGNTPAQSPSLFLPLLPAKKQWPCESDDARLGTPTLHPSYHKPPKETHKLLKDIDPISGRKTINHYEIFQKLGSGQHGTVKQGRDLQNGEMVAIKIVRRFSKKLRLGRSGDPNDMIKKEVAILKKARHPHVVSLIEVIDDHEFGKVYLVLQYVERGEIIWRKQTDKDIAAFEMARIQREIANNVDEDFERAAVTDFNSKAPIRRREKARVLEQQKREAKDRFGAQGYRPFGQPRSDFWSLEFQPDMENETGVITQIRAANDSTSHLQLIDKSSTANATATSTQSGSPNHTPRPFPFSTGSGSAPTSVPPSRPDTPVMHDGTYLEEKFSNDALQSTLDEIIAGQTQWTPDEEDFRYVPCLTLSQALDAFRDTVLGLEYLHYQGIIHRDIKPANLLWTTDYRVKISDFGVSYLGKPIREDDNNEEIEEADAAILDEAIELAKTVGTPAFYAPELCDPQYFAYGKQPDRPAITGQIDVWALGVTLYGMIFGRLPFWHSNEFQMYERIAREEVFIPKMRLRGVSHTDKTPSNHNKRLEDVLEYEEVDNELRDLLKRLLNKQPHKRITLKEVKHHPWVLRGISDQMSWMDETDPSLQSQGRKIEVSTQEVQDAVVGLTLVDRVKAGFQRVGSVLRGRGSRKRAESNPKLPETKPPDSAITHGHSTATPTQGQVHTNLDKDGRRASLRGDEQIYTALRASRENSEHPLAQSVAASPEIEIDSAYFDEEKRPRPVSDPQAIRPSLPDRTLSAADSMKTIRAPPFTSIVEGIPSNQESDDFCTTTAFPDPNARSSSSLGGIFGGAGRRFVNSMRSRERGIERQSPSQSSRSSSADRNIDDPHASPSLALSSVIAAGHVDQPPALREEPASSHSGQNGSSVEAFQRAQEMNNRRQTLEFQRHCRRPTLSVAAEVACPPSPDDEIFFAQQRPASAADSNNAFQISSSSDQIVSGESTPHSRIPSVHSGASSLSAAVDEDERYPLQLEKTISQLTNGRRIGSHSRAQEFNDPPNPALAPAAAEEEAGYNGDSDSDDEGLMIG